MSAFIALPANAQSTGSVTGVVQDTLGAVVVGATITVVGPDGKEKTATSNAKGEFSVAGLIPGKYTVKVIATKFALYENTEVQVVGGQKQELIVPLTVEAMSETVDVPAESGVSTDPEAAAGATVIKGKDLDALPDDPDELAQALQALAGAAAGPNGGQIYIDGFTGGNLPPKESILAIRINQNPFSAEYDRLGFGRIEIQTRPGSDKFRGGANFNFNDEALNSRNPFALNRAASQTKNFGGNLSGPLIKGKSSFFFDINNRQADNNAVVNAVVLDSNLNPVQYLQDIAQPTRRFSFSPRVDYAINKDNALQIRYSFATAKSENQGIGGTTLPSRASESENREHEFRLSETMIISPTTINETRFSYENRTRETLGDNSVPSVSVSSAFSGGGASVGQNFNKAHGWELQNYTSSVLGKNAQHSIKFGARIRGTNYTDRSENGFGGGYSFLGAPAFKVFPKGDPECNVDASPIDGCYIEPAIAPLEQYRGNILGMTGERYLPTFSITVGEPEAKVSQYDYGVFFTDDWRVNPGLTVSAGLRYENQTNISDNKNFAPRFSVAWSPGAGGARAPKTVIRGGFGVFYDRISDNLTLQATRFDGEQQLNYLVTTNESNPAQRAAAIALLNQPNFGADGSVSNGITAAQIAGLAPRSSVVRQIADGIKVPYYYQGAISVEHQLPWRSSVSATYIAIANRNMLRARNINAPICPEQEDCDNAPKPFPTQGSIYEYESTGRGNSHQINVNFRTNFHTRVSLFGSYRLGFAKGDTDGSGSFPAYSYDLSDEFGWSSSDIRHSFNVGGNVSLPWGISLNPFITANTGRAFNLTTGLDPNNDGFSLERPKFSELGAACVQRGLSYSWCDVSDQDPNAIIPRNYARGSKYFAVNMRFGKNFGFGKTAAERAGTQAGQGGGNRGGGGGNRGGGGGGMMGGGGGPMMMGGGGEVRRPYNLNIGVQVTNLFNNVNFGTPIGNLASNRFGEITSTVAGGFGGFGGGGGASGPNRRVELQMRFNW